MLPRILSCGLALALSGCAVATQQVPAGSLVRLRLDTPEGFGHPVTGFYAGATRDSILLRRDSAGPTSGFLRTRVLSLEVGRRGTAKTMGVLIGAAAGVVAASGAVGKDRKRCESHLGVLCGVGFEYFFAKDAMLYLDGVTLGGVLGGVIGNAIPMMHWTRVPLEDLRIGVTPLPGGRTGFGAAFSF